MAKIILSDERVEGITKGNVKGSPWAKFKFLYSLRPGTNRPNITMLLFFLPMIAAVFLLKMMNGGVDGSLPFYSYIGAGYPLSLYVAGQADALILSNTRLFFLLAVAAMGIFSLALAGSFKVIRNGIVSIKVDSEGNASSEISHKRDNLRGIKQNWSVFLIVTLFWAAIGNGIFYLYNVLAAANIEGFVSVIILIMACVFAAFAFVFGMLLMAVTTGYEQRFTRSVVNAFLMTVQNLPSNLFAFILTAAPLALLFINNYIINLLVLMYYAFTGFSLTVYIWQYQSLRIESRYPKYKTLNNANAGKEEAQNRQSPAL